MINLDSLSNGRGDWDKMKIDLIVINGIPVTDSLIDKIKIDPNSIKSVQIVTENNHNTRMSGRRLLLIATK